MKNIAIIILLLLSCCCIAQPKKLVLYYDFITSNYDSIINETYISQALENGVSKTFIYDNDSVKRALFIFNYKNGEKNGICKKYLFYEGHKHLVAKCNFKKNILYGKFTQYNKDGEKEFEGWYNILGKKDSIWSYWRRGKLEKRISYNNDSLESIITYYFRTGKISSEFYPADRIKEKYIYIERYHTPSNSMSLKANIYNKRLTDWTSFNLDGSIFIFCEGEFIKEFPLFRKRLRTLDDLLPYNGTVKYFENSEVVNEEKFVNGIVDK